MRRFGRGIDSAATHWHEQVVELLSHAHMLCWPTLMLNHGPNWPRLSPLLGQARAQPNPFSIGSSPNCFAGLGTGLGSQTLPVEPKFEISIKLYYMSIFVHMIVDV